MATTLSLNGGGLWVATDDEQIIDYLDGLQGSRRVSPIHHEWANRHADGIYEVAPLLEEKLKEMSR